MPRSAGLLLSRDAMQPQRAPEPNRRQRPRIAASRKKGYACAIVLLLALTGSAAYAQDARRGQYLAKAGGCVGCHTEDRQGAVPFAGGRGLKTSFGVFYGPNITPDPQAGVGRWSESQFMQAMRNGVRPDGAHYFPVFPYPSFTQITDGDLRDLWAYLRTLTPDARRNRAHEIKFPFGWRPAVALWKWFFFTPGPFHSERGAPQIDRGAYLVEGLGHCNECHTPRNVLGGLVRSRHLGGVKGPQGKGVPNLTPARLKQWNDAELAEFLTTGITPEFDSADEAMGEVIRNTTSQLSPEDLRAVIAYLRTLPPQPEVPR
ncbi:MAG: cytochrome c [Betaproteobacteria bacterium]